MEALTDYQWYYLLSFLVSVHFYLAVFSAWSTKDPLSALARSRASSNVHALICVVAVTLWFLLYGAEANFTGDGPWILKGVVRQPVDHVFSVLIASSAGYFTADLLVMLSNKDAFDLLSVVHHVILIPSFFMGAVFRVTVTLQFLFLVEELSTVFLNARWFWRANKRVYEITSLLFAVTFLLSRMIYGSAIYYLSIMSYVNHAEEVLTTDFEVGQYWVQLSLCSLSRVLNIYWSALIIGKLFSMKTKGKNRA